MNTLEERLTELEVRLAFIDDAVAALNAAVAMQDQSMLGMRDAIDRLRSDLLGTALDAGQRRRQRAASPSLLTVSDPVSTMADSLRDQLLKSGLVQKLRARGAATRRPARARAASRAKSKPRRRDRKPAPGQVRKTDAQSGRDRSRPRLWACAIAPSANSESAKRRRPSSARRKRPSASRSSRRCSMARR